MLYKPMTLTLFSVRSGLFSFCTGTHGPGGRAGHFKEPGSNGIPVETPSDTAEDRPCRIAGKGRRA